MKKILFLFLILLSSCGEIKKMQEAQEDELRQKEYSELFELAKTSSQRSDTLYLGFRFGMTSKEVNKHFKKLIKEKIVSTDYADRYTTDITLKGVIKRQATFRTEYYKDRLCTFSLVLDDPSDYIFAVSTFKDANKDMRLAITKWLDGKTKYAMFKNNMVIEFKGFLESDITFIDASLIDSLEYEKKLKEKEETDKFKL